jgi:hypothetical protein
MGCASIRTCRPGGRRSASVSNGAGGRCNLRLERAQRLVTARLERASR